MTAFSEHAFTHTQTENSKEQIEGLQLAVDETTRKLEEVQQKRLHAEKEIIQLTCETKKRVGLMMERIEVVDLLQQLGPLLQEERDLSEQLNDEASERKQSSDLHERNELVKTKAESLAAEVLEVKQRLAEVKAHYSAAQALIRAPFTKS